MRETFLAFSPPLIGQEEIDEVVSTLNSDWITTGPKVKHFEERFAHFVGAPAALALNSGTSALHVALATLGIGPGDEVVTTPMTFCSSVHVIEQVGAKPVLVDVARDSLNIDPACVEEAICRRRTEGGRVKAILPVHLYGHPCDMERLRSLATQHRLHVIEDAAHALPATYAARMIGAAPLSAEMDRADLVAFSFYATKNLTTGEGGMLAGAPRLIEAGRLWSLHGMTRDAYKRYSAAGSWQYDVVVPGFKYNMSDIQAAIGIHQLEKLTEFHRRRSYIAARYTRALDAIDEVEVPAVRRGVSHAWHIYAVRLHLERLKISRSRFIEELKRHNIGSSVHFIPIHQLTYYRLKYGFKDSDYPVANEEYQRLVSLPLNPRMTNDDVDDVIEAVGSVATQYRK